MYWGVCLAARKVKRNIFGVASSVQGENRECQRTIFRRSVLAVDETGFFEERLLSQSAAVKSWTCLSCWSSYVFFLSREGSWIRSAIQQVPTFSVSYKCNSSKNFADFADRWTDRHRGSQLCLFFVRLTHASKNHHLLYIVPRAKGGYSPLRIGRAVNEFRM